MTWHAFFINKDMKNFIYTICFTTLLLAATSTDAVAGSNRANLQAHVNVSTVFNATLVSQAHMINITAADIARGYVDIDQATVLNVQTNSRDGYYLNFEAGNHPFSEIWVMDQSRTTLLSNGNGYIHQDNTSSKETKRLSYRFILPKLLPPGSYDWPLIVSAVAN